jgi:hypothetical protein
MQLEIAFERPVDRRSEVVQLGTDQLGRSGPLLSAVSSPTRRAQQERGRVAPQTVASPDSVARRRIRGSFRASEAVAGVSDETLLDEGPERVRSTPATAPPHRRSPAKDAGRAQWCRPAREAGDH